MKTDMDLRIDALGILMPNGYGYSGDETDYEITKPDDSSDDIPTLAEMNAKVAELRIEYDALAYARNRASAYDSVGDQLDMMMKDKRDGTTTHQEACEAVKAKFPKPE
jgi:hypothetical protein